ncbi:MAG: hypothetical protein WD512_14355 [Candidatus Paceibacterota bacterium]
MMKENMMHTRPIDMLLGFRVGAFIYTEPHAGVFTVYCRDFDKNENVIKFSEKYFSPFVKWFGGDGTIQNLLPELSDEERELLISGMSFEDQKKVFK